jgi:hypothetical protein
MEGDQPKADRGNGEGSRNNIQDAQTPVYPPRGKLYPAGNGNGYGKGFGNDLLVLTRSNEGSLLKELQPEADQRNGEGSRNAIPDAQTHVYPRGGKLNPAGNIHGNGEGLGIDFLDLTRSNEGSLHGAFPGSSALLKRPRDSSTW